MKASLSFRKNQPMQDRSSQRQPNAPLSHIDSREQQTVFASSPETTHPFGLAQEIALLPDRRRTFWRAVVSLAGLLFALLCYPLLFILNLRTHGSLLQPGAVAPLVIMLAFTALLCFHTWMRFVHLRLASYPLLTINREGITVGNRAHLNGMLIPWAEIASIERSASPLLASEKCLCIRPQNTDQARSLFRSLGRFDPRLSWRIGTPLTIAEQELEYSVEAILSLISTQYTGIVNAYHVQLRR